MILRVFASSMSSSMWADPGTNPCLKANMHMLDSRRLETDSPCPVNAFVLLIMGPGREEKMAFIAMTSDKSPMGVDGA